MLKVLIVIVLLVHAVVFLLGLGMLIALVSEIWERRRGE